MTSSGGRSRSRSGPITAQYKGAANFVEKDEVGHKAVIKGTGRDSRGQGNASALITAQLSDIGGGKTKVEVNTDLQITGKVAQFGRGVIGDVSEKLLNQFVDCLQSKILAESTVAAAESAVAAAPAAAVPLHPQTQRCCGTDVGRDPSGPRPRTVAKRSRLRRAFARSSPLRSSRWTCSTQPARRCSSGSVRSSARSWCCSSSPACSASVADAADRAVVAQLLGREPQSEFEVGGA